MIESRLNLHVLDFFAPYVSDDIGVSYKGKRIIRSANKHPKHDNNKMQRNRRKLKGRHGKHHKDASGIDQSRNKDSVHNAATLRQKREYADNAFWDPLDSEYEEPLIYDSMDTANVESSEGKASGGTAKKKKSLGDDISGKKYAIAQHLTRGRESRR